MTEFKGCGLGCGPLTPCTGCALQAIRERDVALAQVEDLTKDKKRLEHIISEKPDITPPIKGEHIERFQRLWEACVGLSQKADFKVLFNYAHGLEKDLETAERQLEEWKATAQKMSKVIAERRDALEKSEAQVETLKGEVAKLSEKYGDAGLRLLFEIQDACPDAGIASGLRMGAEVLLRKYKDANRLLGRYQKTLEDIADRHCCDEVCIGPCASQRAKDALTNAERPVCTCSGFGKTVTGPVIRCPQHSEKPMSECRVCQHCDRSASAAEWTRMSSTEDVCPYCGKRVIDRLECGSRQPGAFGAGYGYPLRCTLDRGHAMPHKNEPMGAEWDL